MLSVPLAGGFVRLADACRKVKGLTPEVPGKEGWSWFQPGGNISSQYALFVIKADSCLV